VSIGRLNGGNERCPQKSMSSNEISISMRGHRYSARIGEASGRFRIAPKESAQIPKRALFASRDFVVLSNAAKNGTLFSHKLLKVVTISSPQGRAASLVGASLK